MRQIQKDTVRWKQKPDPHEILPSIKTNIMLDVKYLLSVLEWLMDLGMVPKEPCQCNSVNLL